MAAARPVRVLLVAVAVLFLAAGIFRLKAALAEKAVLAALSGEKEAAAKQEDTGKDASSLLILALKTADPASDKWKPLFEGNAPANAVAPLVEDFSAYVLPLLVQAGSIGRFREAAVTFEEKRGGLSYRDLKALQRLVEAAGRAADGEERRSAAKVLLQLGGAFETASDPCVFRLRLDYIRSGLGLARENDEELRALARRSFESSLRVLPEVARNILRETASYVLSVLERDEAAAPERWLAFIRLDEEFKAAREAAAKLQDCFEGKDVSLEEVFETDNADLLALFNKVFELGQMLPINHGAR